MRRKPGLKARKKRVARIGRVAGAAARKAWATRRERAAAPVFRPAIAADGALLLIGAAKTAELNRAETKVLIGFIRTLDKGEVGA